LAVAQQANPPAEAAGRAALAFVKQTENVPEALRAPMLAEVRARQDRDRWASQVGTKLFAVAARPLPPGPGRSRALPLLLTAAQMVAVHDVLTARALLEAYAGTGLTDAAALREAILRTYRELHVLGEAKAFLLLAQPHEDFAVALVVADEQDLKARLLQPAELAKVRSAYRTVKHAEARTLMARQRWQEALDIWRHLQERRLVSAELYLDAVRCMQELDRGREARLLLEEAWQTYAATASAAWLERCGDRALALGPDGEALAQRAYEKAAQRLLTTPAAP
jgi:hypothetical protein